MGKLRYGARRGAQTRQKPIKDECVQKDDGSWWNYGGQGGICGETKVKHRERMNKKRALEAKEKEKSWYDPAWDSFRNTIGEGYDSVKEGTSDLLDSLNVEDLKAGDIVPETVKDMVSKLQFWGGGKKRTRKRRTRKKQNRKRRKTYRKKKLNRRKTKRRRKRKKIN